MNEVTEAQSILEKKRSDLTKKEHKTRDFINELTGGVEYTLGETLAAFYACGEYACDSINNLEYDEYIFEKQKLDLEEELTLLYMVLSNIGEYDFVSYLKKHMDVCSSAEEIINM